MDRNFVRFVAFVLSLCAAAAAVLVLALALLGMAGCSTEAPESTWPASTENSALEGGQGRFSAHDTNLDGWRILVDRQTGVQYIVGNTVHTVCPLLDADGTPLLVAEAGE